MLARGTNFAFVDLHPMFVGMFWGQASLEQGQQFVEASQAFLSSNDGPHCVLTIVTPDSTAPPSELRGLLREAIGIIGESSTCYAGVILGSGVKASALRAIMGTLLLAMRRVSKGRVCGSVDDGLQWCASHLEGLDVARVRHAVEVHGPKDAVDSRRGA